MSIQNVEKLDVHYHSMFNGKALLKILAVLFLNQFFDVFHAAHNYIEKLKEEREMYSRLIRLLKNNKGA
ncbi:hypothetical protein COF84_27215 [Bacillus wiedmannii]|uniref:hypothetical protein n=1 Tax=Bacillus wiedmannii TaxID=1890302 RepID=UPI000BFC3011|nr:hypothetical protein [Bacillus wiedmannii]PHF10408.1 hypothetical protein COF84_27215 [Bacillus wiedmannii]